jgi:hypothetical protein
MSQESTRTRDRDLELVTEVAKLSEEVKALALSLALYLAKAKSGTHSAELSRLEPEFIRLVNGTVRMVQELTQVLNAARNRETMAYQAPSGRLSQDRIEVKLYGILEQCTQIMNSLKQTKGFIS